MNKVNTTLITLALLTVSTTTAFAQSTTPQIDTSDWKTYRNETMGFEVKYPNTWHVRQITGIGPESVSLDETPQVGKPNVSVQFWVQRQINQKGLSIGEWYTDQAAKIQSAPPSTTNTVIGGRPAIRTETVGTLGRNYAFFTSLNKTDIFEITITQASSQQQLDQRYGNILSTIRFINDVE